MDEPCHYNIYENLNSMLQLITHFVVHGGCPFSYENTCYNFLGAQRVMLSGNIGDRKDKIILLMFD